VTAHGPLPNVDQSFPVPVQRGSSVILKFKPGRFARLRLSSGETLVISIGYATAKVFSDRALVGWLLPKTVVAEKLSVWQPDYLQYNAFYRKLCRAMILEGLLGQVCECGSIDQVRQKWRTLQNPVVAGAWIFQADRSPDA
jgi:hypothetical protein